MTTGGNCNSHRKGLISLIYKQKFIKAIQKKNVQRAETDSS